MPSYEGSKHGHHRPHRDTLLMLCRAIVLSMLDYGCIVYGSASNIKLDSSYNARLRLARAEYCTSPVSNMYTEANEAPLEKRQLKLSAQCYLKTYACTDNQAHHTQHELIQPQEISLFLGQMDLDS